MYWITMSTWRECLGLTRTVVAHRLGISQCAYAQQEAKETVRKSIREKIARALKVAPGQLTICRRNLG